MSRASTRFTGRLADAEKSGPLSFLNPTTRRLTVQNPAPVPQTDDGAAPAPAGAELRWTSRNNRKGRHLVVLRPEAAHHIATPSPTNTLPETLRGLGKMFVRFPVWDISYDVATIFTLGSVVWVINGFFVWLPLQLPSSAFPGESDLGGAITAFIGATIFEFGSVLLMLEAVNENRADCFGWAVEEALESATRSSSSTTALALLRPHHDECRHSHQRKGTFLRPSNGMERNSDSEGGHDGGSARREDRKWSWMPSLEELRTHYIRDIGFLACLSQMTGATIFWIAGLTGLPPILDVLSVPAENGVYWLPQVIGGTGFIVSSLLFMLETQTKWYLPAPKLLGWHVGFWNLVGAIGFTLCGALGFAVDVDGVEYALTLSTFVGSWAFLIGSVIQWYESLDKYPISIEGGEAGSA